MDTKIINAENAPAAVGPYCHAVEAGDFVFTSGQIGLDPQTQELKEGVAAQTKQVLANLGAVLKASDLTLDNVIKTTVFLADINDFAEINEIYEEAFGDNKPARSCVQAGALPKGALIEIEVIAVKVVKDSFSGISCFYKNIYDQSVNKFSKRSLSSFF